MQLQFQQVQVSQLINNDSLIQKKQSIRQFLYPNIYQPSLEFLIQLDEIEKTVKAHNFYLNRLKIKTFNIILQLNYAYQIQLLEKTIFGFKQLRLQRNLLNIHKLQFYMELRKFYQSVVLKKEKKRKAIQNYNKTIQKAMFQQLKQAVIIEKKLKKVHNNLVLYKKQQFIIRLKNTYHTSRSTKQQNEQTNNIVKQIYQSKLLKKYFIQLLMGKNIYKLQKFKIKNNFKTLLFKIKQYKLKCNQLIFNFKESQFKKLLRVTFNILNQDRLNRRVIQWSKKKYLRIYFNEWINFYIQKNNQKQIDQSNEIILKHYLQLKLSDKQIKAVKICFLQWKQWTSHQKIRKRQQKILKTFAQIKYKQILLRKYFQIIKQNKAFQKAKRFYIKNVKSKVFDCFKQFLIKQTMKLLCYFKFVQNRNVKRYFDKMKQFNRKQRQKIDYFLLNKYWVRLTLSITKQYFDQINKAQDYYRILLKFKIILALRKNVQFNHKANYFAYYLNIVKPFKKWRKDFKIRKNVYVKDLILMKKILFEMKCQTIRKQKYLQQNEKYNNNYQQLLQKNDDLNSFNIGSIIISKLKYQQPQKEQYKQFPGQTSFFRKIQSSKTSNIENGISNYQKTEQSDSEDQIQKKLNSLLNRIKKQKPKKQLSKDKFSDQIQNNKSKKRQIIRIPTWSTPGQDYKVSIFQQEEI